MNNGEISANSAASSGGGVYVSNNGTFAMNNGKISANSAASSGGGVYVFNNGTFTMGGGEISANSAASSGGGVYADVSGIYSGTFTMSGGARVSLDNPVYLAYSSAASAALARGGAFTGSDTVALVECGAGVDFIGKPAVKWAEGQSGALPVDRIAFSSGWTADSNGVLGVGSSVPLTAPGETRGAYLSSGAVHFYRFAPVPNSAYTVTLTRENPEYSYNYIYAAAVWADGGGTLMTHRYYYYNDYNKDDTSPAFIANKPGTDIIIMVYDGTGNYTVKYNKE
jgi:hypothetical protein